MSPGSTGSRKPTTDEVKAWDDEQRATFADAVKLITLGVPIIPVGADKRPYFRWALGKRNYVTDPATLDDALAWTHDRRTKGWAALSGDKTLRLFTIDAEAPGMDYPEISGLFSNPLLPPSCQRTSPSGGMHAVCVVTDGEPIHTQALASIGPAVARVLLCEIRGVSKGDKNGAYAMITGPGRGHLPDDFAPAPVTRAQIDPLLDMVRALHQPTELETRVRANVAAGNSGNGTGSATATAICDAVTTRALSWLDILEPGWSIVSDDGDRIGLLRPGNPSSSESANAVGPVLAIHSSAVDWAVEQGETISAAQVYARCWHGGDFRAAMSRIEVAAAALAEDGVAPGDHLAAWPAPVLRAVHDARQAETKAWRAKENADTDAMLASLAGTPAQTAPTATTKEAPVTADSAEDTATTTARPLKGQSLIAQALAARQPGQYMFVPGVGWHVWDGMRWSHGNGHAEYEVARAVKKQAELLIRQSASADDDHKRRLMQTAANRVLDKHAEIRGVMGHLALIDGILASVEDLNADPYLLNCRNGTLDLRTGELKPHDPRDRITKVTGCDYDPDATAPNWEAFLAFALPDPLVRAALARFVGGAVLPGTVIDHLMMFITGPGGGGKGTCFGTLHRMLNDYAISPSPDLITAGSREHPTAKMDLLGARLVLMSETDDGRHLSIATMKRLTGGDRIRARAMRENYVEFDPSHQLVMLTNHLPVINAADDTGTWRRVNVIRFDHPPAAPDGHLQERLLLELTGILAWAMRGRADYEARGGYDWPDAVKSATEAYRQSSDAIGDFLAERTERTPPQVAAIPVGALYNEWLAWRKARAPKVPSGRVQDFKAKLAEHGLEVEEGDGRNSRAIVRGLRIVDNDDEFFDLKPPG